jgi:hypothetical protein
MELTKGGCDMKIGVKLTFFAVFFFVIHSCTTLENTCSEDMGLYPAEIGVSMSSGDKTKVYLGDSDNDSNTTPIYWSDDESDQIKVKVDGVDYTFQKVGNTSNSKNAKFRCELAPAVESGKTYTATYSSDGFNSIGYYQSGTKSSLKDHIDLSATYTAKEGDTWNDVVFNFEMERAIVKITLNSDIVNDVGVGVDLMENGKGLVTSTSTVELSQEGVAEFYFVLEPREYNEITMEVTLYICGDPLNFQTREIRYEMNDITIRRNNMYYVEKQLLIDTSIEENFNVVKLSGEDNSSTANSYILNPVTDNPVLGKDNTIYRIYAKYKGNSFSVSDEIGSRIKKVKVLWESDGTNSPLAQGAIITRAIWHNDFIYFDINGSGAEGNALLGAFDNDDNIVWSWHIWVTDTPQEHQYEDNNGSVFGTYMDRNLGALCADGTAVENSGLFYQWGRKDPFLPGNVSCAMMEGASWNKVSVDNSTGSIEYAIEHPMTYLYSTSSPFTWIYVSSSESVQSSMWGASKTVYDPCPYGWKVTESNLGNNIDVSSGRGSFNSTTGNYELKYKKDKGDVAYFPTSGRYSYSTGEWIQAGLAGFYWSSTVSRDSEIRPACSFYFDDQGNVNPARTYFFAEGASVRCKKM